MPPARWMWSPVRIKTFIPALTAFGACATEISPAWMSPLINAAIFSGSPWNEITL